VLGWVVTISVDVIIHVGIQVFLEAFPQDGHCRPGENILNSATFGVIFLGVFLNVASFLPVGAATEIVATYLSDRSS